MGAHAVIDVTRQDLIEHVKAETDGFGVDVAIECAGAAGSARSCLNALRPLGHYTQVGHFGKDVTVRWTSSASNKFAWQVLSATRWTVGCAP